jgi:cytochrome P450
MLTRHADVSALLRDPRFSSDRSWRTGGPAGTPSAPGDLEAMQARMFLFLDPPAQTQLRGCAGRGFRPAAIATWEARVEQQVDALLDGLEPGAPVDFVKAVAEPLPVLVIAELLGLPRDAWPQLKRWSDAVAGWILGQHLPGDRWRVRAQFAELRAFLGAMLAERRERPRDDVLSALAPDPDALPTSMLLLLAGHETTTSLLGLAALCLLRHPAERARLVAQPELLPSAVEEVLRCESPVRLTRRFAREPVSLGGVGIARGERVVALLGVANRDPDVFPDPERFDVARSPNPHLAFGSGVHFCLGAHLARLETRLALGALLRRFPRLEGDPTTARARPGVALRTLESLPLRLRAA